MIHFQINFKYSFEKDVKFSEDEACYIYRIGLGERVRRPPRVKRFIPENKKVLVGLLLIPILRRL